MKTSRLRPIVAVLLGVFLVFATLLAAIWLGPCVAITFVNIIAAGYWAWFLLTEVCPSPREGSRPMRLQFDLRDILLAFLVTAGAMGTAGAFGIVLGFYLLALIVVFRIGRATRAPAASVGLGGLIVFGFCGLCLLPAFQTPNINYRSMACQNNLKQIALALQNHLSDRNSLPEAHLADENGVPMHSWRVAILPYIEETNLYEQYDREEPWDGPGNSKLSNRMPYVFTCPTDLSGGPPITNYVAVTGPGTGWPENRGSVPNDFRDGMSQTLVLAEVHGSGIHWMEPRDLTLDDLAQGMQPQSGLGISSDHFGGAYVAFADGSVRFLSNSTSPELLRGLATVDGGEQIDPAAVENRDRAYREPATPQPGTVTWFCSLFLMLISAVVLAFRPLRRDDPKAEPSETEGGES